ncbi:Stress response protein nst1 [Podila clonocystis]|nr:Stress response protein nst1 [Podila clonocystis]
MVSHGKSPSTRAMSSRANSRAPATVSPDGGLIDSDQDKPNRPFLRSLGMGHPMTQEEKSLNAAIEAINQAALAEHIDLSKLTSAGYVWDPSPARRKRFFKNYNNMPFQDLKDLNIGLIKGKTNILATSKTVASSMSSSSTAQAQAQGTHTKRPDDDSLSDPEDKVNGSLASKKKKKKKKKTASTDSSSPLEAHPESTTPGSSIDQTITMGMDTTSGDRIWNTSDAEERQRIRAFWFQLPERDRRTLVRLEKEAVMEKMKEQQRHACPCAVCGRKRSAIEDELEQLYDAYYDELEEYAHQLKDRMPTKTTSVSSTNSVTHHAIESEKGKKLAHAEDIDQDGHDSHDSDGSQDSNDSHDSRDGSADDEDDTGDDIDGLGSSIDARTQLLPYDAPNIAQAAEGILNVAEDLLGNNGEKFLEMMDRLELEGRLECTPRVRVTPSTENTSLEEEEEKCENEDALTKELRMEEGRKMFQAFAARMFEQRVLIAYREQIAEERRLKLLQELEDETRQEQLREERKEREKEKKREKKRIQKQQKDEEKAVKEAQRLAEEQRIAEERRQKAEAIRKRKDEERRVKEERIARELELHREEARKRDAKAREDDQRAKAMEDAKEVHKDPSPVAKNEDVPMSIPISLSAISPSHSPISKPVAVGEAISVPPLGPQPLESLWSQSFPSILPAPSRAPSKHPPRSDFTPRMNPDLGENHDFIPQEYAGHIPSIDMSFHEPDFGLNPEYPRPDEALLRDRSMFFPESSVEYEAQMRPAMSSSMSPNHPSFSNRPSLAARNILPIGSRKTSAPGRGSDSYVPIERPMAMGPEYHDVASETYLKPTGPLSAFGELSIGLTEFVGNPRPRSLSVGLVEDIALPSGQFHPQYHQHFQEQHPYQPLYQEQPFQPFQQHDAFMPSEDGFSGHPMDSRYSTLDFLMHDDEHQSSLFADSFFNRDNKGTLDPFGAPSYSRFLAQRHGSLPNVSLPSGQ